MTASLDLGDNYQIEENSNGNLVVRDSGGTIVLKHEDGGNFQLGDAGLELGDLIDGSSGATVYDGASETLGDGSQLANLDSLSTIQQFLGEGNDASGIGVRPMVTESETRVDVPQDYTTIQSALNDVPLLLRHSYVISVDETAGDFDEDIIVPPVISMSMEDASGSDNPQLRLTRQGSSGNWTTSSIYAAGGYGVGPAVRLDFPEVTAENPYSNENAAIGIYGGHCDTFGATFTPDTSITVGVLHYGAKGNLDGTSSDPMDFTAGGVDTAYYSKSEAGPTVITSPSDAHVGSVNTIAQPLYSAMYQIPADLSLSGSYETGDGTIFFQQNQTLGGAEGPGTVEQRPYESVQDALDRADSIGALTVRIDADQHNEAVTIPRDGMRLVGAGRASGLGNRTEIDARGLSGDPPAIDTNGQSGVVVEGMRLRTSGTDAAVVNSSRCAFRDCIFNSRVQVGGFGAIVKDNLLQNNEILLTSNANQSVVTGNVDVGTITDNSTDSQVANNT
jgi:hypothetical protein